MNIFVLDKEPTMAAQYQCDKHVVKMILESAQLLCSIWPDGEAPYKRTHYNHPCAIWTRTSRSNYDWLLLHSYALLHEYQKRYGKIHKSKEVIDFCSKSVHSFTSNVGTEWPQCMPDQYKMSNDVVQAYRNYYIGEKMKFAKWKLGNTPYWWPKTT